ncbi:wee1-like protein kinase [Phalaenopsis equestris]|uniref:wee1-like protein kinase n=1 Tax=Phalaenopsis equestris TaxID=78828 RepID=UPI0009E338C7|nr:wee1-like protein kinase [Phalaenopsis equestris]
MKKSIPAGDLSHHLERMPRFPLYKLSGPPPPPPSRFQRKLMEVSDGLDAPSSIGDGVVEIPGDRDCILSQDFFCTPDYVTPEIPNNLKQNKENIACPKSPEKSVRNKRHKQVCSPPNSQSTSIQLHEEDAELKFDEFGFEDLNECKSVGPALEKKQRFVSQSAVALRCRAMPPPCIKNPYIIENSSIELDVFGDRIAKVTGFSPSIGGARYRTDFHEVEQIGSGNFSNVFKALKRIDGCLYAVKHSIKQFRNDMERRFALREVQALAALGHHANIVGYHTSWFENDKLYIQMELCEHSLSKGCIRKSGDVFEVLYQMSTALNFMHCQGIAHMDVKPENIYVKHCVYKLGDFGCAILTDKSLPIEEGDSRYMPQEILNDKYEHLDKVDIFSLGAAIYELIKGSPLPESGSLFCNLREGKIPLLPGYSMQFQNVLKAMMDPDPVKRPSAREIMENPIFERIRKTKSRKE